MHRRRRSFWGGWGEGPRRKRSPLFFFRNHIGGEDIAMFAIDGQFVVFGFQSQIESDCAPLNHLVLAVLDAGINVRCIRDLTRGGLVSAANEIAGASGLSIMLREVDIPVREDVRAACEVLGLDPLYVANEGRLMVIVPDHESSRTIEIMQSVEVGEGSCRIGAVGPPSSVPVRITSTIGVDRVLDMVAGEQLPRIC